MSGEGSIEEQLARMGVTLTPGTFAISNVERTYNAGSDETITIRIRTLRRAILSVNARSAASYQERMDEHTREVRRTHPPVAESQNPATLDPLGRLGMPAGLEPLTRGVYERTYAVRDEDLPAAAQRIISDHASDTLQYAAVARGGPNFLSTGAGPASGEELDRIGQLMGVIRDRRAGLLGPREPDSDYRERILEGIRAPQYSRGIRVGGEVLPEPELRPMASVRMQRLQELIEAGVHPVYPPGFSITLKEPKPSANPPTDSPRRVILP
jgi:hypothetical protein